MTSNAAIEQINKAIDEYDNGVISRTALATVVGETVATLEEDVRQSAFNEGYQACDDDVNAEDEEDEYELDIDLDAVDDTDDHDINF
jgi:hypothetical protein